MNLTLFRTGFHTVIGFALNCLLSFSPANVSGQANTPLDGVFSIGNWRVRLDDRSGTGVFTAVGNSSRKTGESFLTISARSGYNSWRGRAFDRTFSTISESAISIKGDQLIITPKTGPAYILKRVPAAPAATSVISSPGKAPSGYSAPKKAYSATASTTRRSGAGCTSVQCHGITRAGNRCRRTTTNCSGYCYQH